MMRRDAALDTTRDRLGLLTRKIPVSSRIAECMMQCRPHSEAQPRERESIAGIERRTAQAKRR